MTKVSAAEIGYIPGWRVDLKALAPKVEHHVATDESGAAQNRELHFRMPT